MFWGTFFMTNGWWDENTHISHVLKYMVSGVSHINMDMENMSVSKNMEKI